MYTSNNVSPIELIYLLMLQFINKLRGNNYMNNINDVPLSKALQNRCIAFFLLHSDNIAYNIIKLFYIVIFIIPFLVTSLAEFVILTILSTIGKLGETLTSFCGLQILWLPTGLILGVLYFVIYKIFSFIFYICILPDIIFGTSWPDV